MQVIPDKSKEIQENKGYDEQTKLQDWINKAILQKELQ
jgi:hypothetical protein